VLDIPYGSLWILEVLNPAKTERNAVDRVIPMRRFVAASLFLDSSFGFRFVFRTIVHFLRHRIFTLRAWSQRIRMLPRLLAEEVFNLGGYDEVAMRYLMGQRGVHTLIVGHSHGPRFRLIGDTKVLINTGTWMKMINLNIQYLGQDSGLTYAVIDYDENGKPQTSLMRWHGGQQVCEAVPYAD
jgi:hypothetical protein